MRGGKLRFLVSAVTPRPEYSGAGILELNDAVLLERRGFA